MFRPQHNPQHNPIATILLLAAAVLSAAHVSGQSPTQPSPTPVQTAAPEAAAPLNPALPTLFIVGDSTARNQADLGWGDHLAHYFDTTRINVANRGRAGRSSRTFINEGLWDKVLAEMKPGDFVLIQMGHNDGDDISGPKARGSLKGIGEETQQLTFPDGHQELVHTYGWYIRHYIDDTRGEQATPILLSLTIRDIWSDGKIERDMGYDAELAQIAKDQDIAFVDMATVEADRLEALGPEKTALLFPVDHTHTSAEGAELNAQFAATALRNAKSRSPLTSNLSLEDPQRRPGKLSIRFSELLPPNSPGESRCK